MSLFKTAFKESARQDFFLEDLFCLSHLAYRNDTGFENGGATARANSTNTWTRHVFAFANVHTFDVDDVDDGLGCTKVL